MRQNNKLTAIYCRVASADEYALEAQQEYLCRFAGGLGYGNVRIYADNGYSGLNLVDVR